MTVVALFLAYNSHFNKVISSIFSCLIVITVRILVCANSVTVGYDFGIHNTRLLSWLLLSFCLRLTDSHSEFCVSLSGTICSAFIYSVFHFDIRIEASVLRSLLSLSVVDG